MATRERHCPRSNPLGSQAPRVGSSLVFHWAGLCSAPVSPGTLSSITPAAESGGVQGVPPVGSDWEDSWDTPPAPLLPPTPTI